MMKACTQCGEHKEMEEFHVRRASRDGHAATCKVCMKIRDADQFQRHRDKKLASMRAYQQSPRGAAVHASAVMRDRGLNAKRHAARMAVNKAIKDGTLVKPAGCWCCGRSPVEAHHPDYDRPLDVVWLCIPEHKEVHVMTRKMRDGCVDRNN